MKSVSFSTQKITRLTFHSGQRNTRQANKVCCDTELSRIFLDFCSSVSLVDMFPTGPGLESLGPWEFKFSATSAVHVHPC